MVVEAFISMIANMFDSPKASFGIVIFLACDDVPEPEPEVAGLLLPGADMFDMTDAMEGCFCWCCW